MAGRRTKPEPLRAWARTAVELIAGTEPDSPSGFDPVAVVADRVAQAFPVEGALPEDKALSVSGFPVADETRTLEIPEPPGGWANPWLVGIAHEHAVSAESRSARGAWYTPRGVVEGLVALAAKQFDESAVPDLIIDPTCGGGAFLLAALDYLVSGGCEPADALNRIAGLDIDAGAVVASRLSIALWAASHGFTVDVGAIDVAVGDALEVVRPDWPKRRLVVGNPPFASPLRSGAVPETADMFRQARADYLGPYSDLSAIHLLAAVENAGDGSVVAFVQPQSILAGRDAALLRQHLSEVAPLRALWACREPVFDAGVRACGVVLTVGGATVRPAALASGVDVAPMAREASPGSSWADLAAQALGAPSLPSWMDELATDAAEHRLGTLASATAGFRDEFYGLVAACREATPEETDPNRLLTVGLVDPLADKWGIGSCKFGGKQWARPTIDLDELDTKVGSWTKRQLVPKLVVATQSRVLEPVIDRVGRCIPATPLLSVTSEEDDLDRVAAVLLAPPVTVWAWRRWFGSALSVDAVKLAAHQVEKLPLPADRDLWERAASTINQDGVSAIEEVARLMNEAYGADDAVLEWWLARYRRLASVLS